MVVLNHAPSVAGESVSIDEDNGLVIDPALLLANDSDPDQYVAQTLGVVAVSNAMHGSVDIRADGMIVFVPDADWFGPASFDYTVSDGHGGETQATVAIDVRAVNDAPVAAGETAGAP